MSSSINYLWVVGSTVITRYRSTKMKLKILDPQVSTIFQAFDMFFDLNGDEYELCTDKNHKDFVDILVCNHFYGVDNLSAEEYAKSLNYNLMIFLDINHNVEHQVTVLNERANGSLHDYTVTNAVDLEINNPRVIYNDFLFNRTKAYYFDYPFRPNSHKWYYKSKLNYQIPKHKIDKQKIFVAPNNARNGARKFRHCLVDFLLSNYSSQGYIGDPSRIPPTVLFSQFQRPHCLDIDSLEKEIFVLADQFTRGGYCPPHTLYYDNTFISIYAETIEFGSTFAPTEKTFDPLIRGHFVVPFANYKFIDFIKHEYDFKFPDFINYEYDNIKDDEKRFAGYIDEIKRLMTIDIDSWNQLRKDNIDLIQHNQNVFYNRPYHRVDFSKLL
jgi:hypothetical protein